MPVSLSERLDAEHAVRAEKEAALKARKKQEFLEKKKKITDKIKSFKKSK